VAEDELSRAGGALEDHGAHRPGADAADFLKHAEFVVSVPHTLPWLEVMLLSRAGRSRLRSCGRIPSFLARDGWVCPQCLVELPGSCQGFTTFGNSRPVAVVLDP